MAFCVDLISEDSFYENITLGITKLLEANPRICNVTVDRRLPCDRTAISSWEQRHSVQLPDDLRHFYSSTDGFHLEWHYKYSDEEILPVGLITVNPLIGLCLSSTLKDLIDFSLTRTNTEDRPALNAKSKVFELDSCRSIGKVCLVYTSGSWSLWLVTREGTWSHLADSFTQYFRMALVHLGLPSWQAAYAKLPLIPWAEQLFLLLAPHLLDINESSKEDTTTVNIETITNKIDPSIFKTSARHHKKHN